MLNKYLKTKHLRNVFFT